MQFNEIITFEGGINTDDTPQGMPKGDYRDFSYCRLGYNSGNAYAVETSDGTLVIPNPPATIEIQDQIIGATQWQKENSIVYFVFKADLIHEIWVYDITNQTHTRVIQSTELNFSRDWPVFHANVIDDILKWTDGRWDPLMYDSDGNRLFNPPYQINLRKALDGYYPIFNLRTIDAVKWPMEPPVVTYFTDPTRNDNKLRNKLFKFIIQPIYENGEVGVWSMYSNLDLPNQSELVSGTNWVFLNNDNGISIQFNTGPSIIRKFNLAVQQYDRESEGAEVPFGVFLQLDKDLDSLADNDIYFVDFYGDAATGPAMDFSKNYDRLPIVADCQEYLPTNQLAYINFREGYDKPTEEPFIVDASMSYDVTELVWRPRALEPVWQVLVNTVTADFVMRFNASAVPSLDVNNFFVFEPGMVISIATPNNIFPAEYRNVFLYFYVTQGLINEALTQPTIFDQNAFVFEAVGNSFVTQWDPTLFIVPGSITSLGALGMEYQAANNPGSSVITNWIPATAILENRTTDALPSLKVGATHEFGIVYGDRAYRDSTVYTLDSLKLFVPWFADEPARSTFVDGRSPYTVTPRMRIDHIPPVWATKYWVVAKPATEILSFGQYISNNNQDGAAAGSGYVQSIKLDAVTNNRYIIYIDNYYENQNLGATIKHEIKIGDKLRFVRQSLFGTGAVYLDYLELDIIDIDTTIGTDGRIAVYTNLFDLALVEPEPPETSGFVFGQMIEIYTPRPSTDSTGNIFISTWEDVTEAIPIRNPHTEDRSHNVPPLHYLYVTEVFAPGNYRFSMNGDQTSLIGETFNYTIYNDDGTTITGLTDVVNALYISSSNITAFLSLVGITAVPSMSYMTFDGSAVFGYQRQVVSNLTSFTPAVFTIDYGDVYVRKRNWNTGLGGLEEEAYYFMEDPHYSDYWNSDIHNTGRTRIEDVNARMTHRQSTAIHSDSFIVGTQINGLSSFALDNQNIEDMNPIFGPVTRAYMSGREGKTLKCLQPKKENSIYIQYYPNEVGSDSTVRVSNKTFASWFDYKSLLGCSNAGATAILPNGSTMYFDNNAGVFVYSGGNGQIQVSEIDPDTKTDYKFRTKTKALAAAYNASSAPMVRTYVNESVGEVGFAFRFDSPYSGEALGGFNPAVGQVLEVFILQGGNFEYLYGYDMFFYFNGTGNVYQGTVNLVDYVPIFNYTRIGLEGVTPDIADFDEPGYYYTTSGLSYDHVVFDYVNMRWRSTYDYNFQQYCNLGQTLVGWGADNQLYLHNQPNQWNFHGDPFVQQVSFVSNESPLALKRYQDIGLVSDDLFSITAESEPNRSYPRGMKTTMPTNLISTYEGYGKVNYRKNLYDPKFFIDSNTSATSYAPPLFPTNGWTLAGDQTGLLNDPLAVPPIPADTITIIQLDGNIYTGQVDTAVYDAILDVTTITLVGSEPSTFGVNGSWYFTERALCNGEDIRANALTHTLEYDPAINNTPSILFSVGIRGVLS
jgi:hypothetical protein